MNLKLILVTTELVLIVVGMLTFAYAVYSMHTDAVTANNTGEKVVNAHRMLLYAHLVVQLLQLTTAALIMYKV